MEERRIATIEMVLIELGKVQQMQCDVQRDVADVKECIQMQNGRVKDVELWRENINGQIKIIQILVIPVALYIVYLVINFVAKSIV